MKGTLVIILSIVCVLTIAATEPGWGQATPGEMASFPMPPNYVRNTKNFQFAGDYLYELVENYAVFPTDTGPNTYAYIRYTGLAGKNINIWPRVATSIPVPDLRGDACAHTHMSYGVWARFELNVAGIRISGQPFIGGGGMSGVRNPQGVCELKVQNNLTSFSPAFGWGSDFTTFNVMPNQTFIKELIVGASVPTHGWGTCAPQPGGFSACFEPVRVNVWTLPLSNTSPNLGINFSNPLFSETQAHWRDVWPVGDSGFRTVTAQGTFPPTCPLTDIVLEMVDRNGNVVSRSRMGGPAATMGAAGAFITSQNLGTTDTTVTVRWWFDAYNISRYRVRYTGLGQGCP